MDKKEKKTEIKKRRFELSKSDQKIAQDVWKKIRTLRRRQALRQNWIREWSRKIGPLAAVLPPKWKQEGGRV